MQYKSPVVRARPVIAALLLLGFILAIWGLPGGEPTPPPAQRSTTPAGDLVDIATGAPRKTSLDRQAVAGPAADPANGAATAAATFRIRLRGQHPQAPWRTPLILDLEGRDEGRDSWLQSDQSAVPDAEGLVSFPLPPWMLTASRPEWRLRGNDPHYLPIEERAKVAPDPDHELVVDVQVIAVLLGRVVTSAGEPVPGARITAYGQHAGQPSGGALGTTNSANDGSYHLLVPPDMPLLVTAVAMAPALLSGMKLTGLHGAISDRGELVPDLLPASLSATGAVGTFAELPDLVLPPAARLLGTVRWANGNPVAGAVVSTAADDGERLPLDQDQALLLTPAGLTLLARTRTAADGTFVLPARSGTTTTVRIADVQGHHVVGPWPSQRVVAPSLADLELPLPIEVQVRSAGQPVARARVGIVQLLTELVVDGSQLPGLVTDAHGSLRLITQLDRLSLQAEANGRRSAFADVVTATAQVVVLDLDQQLAEVAIEFRGEFPVRNVRLTWQRSDGAHGTEHLLRDDRGEPFRLFLEPGEYMLHVAPAGGERNGLFLMPGNHRLVVGTTPQRLELTATFGGRFTVFATDGRGVHVAGQCRVIGPDGRVHEVKFRQRDSGAVGAAGELLADGPNEALLVLAPGEYVLECGFAEHGACNERVTIRPREIVDVRLRLP